MCLKSHPQRFIKSFTSFQEYEHALKFYRRGEKHSRKLNRTKFLAGIRICRKKILKDLNSISIMDNDELRYINKSIMEVE